jgi:uncharacterized protein YaeQ
MALGATIYRLELAIADMDRHYYGNHSLTLARHPSENDERLMLRVLAFILHASEEMQFGKGVSTEDEPDLWQHNLTGEIEHWIDLGLPDEKRIRKACGRASRVDLITYGGSRADMWFAKHEAELQRFEHLRICSVDPETCRALAAIANRSMSLDASIQDAQVLISDGQQSVQVAPVVMKP